MIAEEEPVSLEVEVQSLKAIFNEELEVNRTEDEGGSIQSLVLQMSPDSAKGESQQFVHFEIILEIPNEYPQAIPKITLRNVRGLSEEAQASTKDNMKKRAEELSGSAMLFELIQVAKEQLTSENIPSIPCSICLFSFHTEDSFSRTPCFHFFHTHCLATHVQHTLAQKESPEDKIPLPDTTKEEGQEVQCPVCRLPIPFKESDPEKFPVPRESLKEEGDIVLTAEVREMQQKMANLFSQQQAKGSIIDLEAEKNKFFIEISNTPDIPVMSTSPAKQSNEPTGAGGTGKVNPESIPEHLQKHYDTKQKSSKFSGKGQTVKVVSKEENSDGRQVNVKESHAVSNWEDDEDSEKNHSAASNKRYSTKENPKGNEREKDQRRETKTDEAKLDDEGKQRRLDREQTEEKRNRPRSQVHDHRYKQVGIVNANDGNASEEKKLDCESTIQDDTSTSAAYRANKKKKSRWNRNYDRNDNLEARHGRNEQGVTQTDPQSEGSEKSEERNLAEKPQSAEDASESVPYYSRKHSVRTDNSGGSDRVGQFRNNRQNRYRPNDRDSARRYSDKHSEDLAKSETSADQADSSKTDGQISDGRVNSGGYPGNRYRNSNQRGRGTYNRGRDYRPKAGNFVNNESFIQTNSESTENQTRSEEPKSTLRNQTTDRHYQNKYRDRFASKRFNSEGESWGARDDVANANIPSQESDSHKKFQENRKYENPRVNRKFQKNYSNDGDLNEVPRNTDTSKEHAEEQFGNQKPRYRNRYDYYRRQQNYNYERDDGLRNTNSASDNTSETNLHGGGTQESVTGYKREGYRNFPKTRPRYGSNNNKPDFDRDQQAAKLQATKEDVNQEQGTLPQNAYTDSDANPQRDYTYKRNWSDRRTYHRENWSGGNYNSRQRNGYHGVQGQQAALNLLSQAKQDAALASNTSDQSFLKQSIKPFTHMYSSTTQDAQTVVSIPPPF